MDGARQEALRVDAESNAKIDCRPTKEVKLKPPTERELSRNQGNQGRGARNGGPSLTQLECVVIKSHCVCNMLDDHQIQRLVCGELEEVTLGVEGRMIGQPDSIRSLKLIMRKSEAITILTQHGRDVYSKWMEQALQEILSRFFSHEPSLCIYFKLNRNALRTKARSEPS